MKIMIINGPNLNFLGIREPSTYGKKSYKDLVNYLKKIGKDNKIKLKVVHSNDEGKIIDFLQYAYHKKYDGIVLNAGAYTHYSYAIRDAIASINIPVVEVHLSDIFKREDFRKISVIEEVCTKTFMGKHFESYREAIVFLKENK